MVNSCSQQSFLLVDDSSNAACTLREIIRGCGYNVETPVAEESVPGFVSDKCPVVVISAGADGSGLSLCLRLGRLRPTPTIVFVASRGGIRNVVPAMRAGAFDVIDNIDDAEQIRRTIHDAATRNESVRGAAAGEQAGQSLLLGDCQIMKTLRSTIREVATTDASVMILGETGCGKELVAREIHNCSKRTAQVFVPVNVAGFPAGLIESMLFGHCKGAFTGATAESTGLCDAAHRGTLFLDEIGEMPIELQPKLLRFLQEMTVQRIGSTKTRNVDVRILSATNRDLQQQIQKNSFRSDLYFRLHVVPIEVPPLRHRADDIPVLARAFLEKHAASMTRPTARFSSAAMDCLMQYSWPGNVRELMNMIERIVVFSTTDEVVVGDLPGHVRSGAAQQVGPSMIGGSPANNTSSKPHPCLKSAEQRLIIDTLKSTRGNVGRAAKLLGIGQATLYRRMKKYGFKRQHAIAAAR